MSSSGELLRTDTDPGEPTRPPDVDLLRGIASGGRVALWHLYERYAPTPLARKLRLLRINDPLHTLGHLSLTDRFAAPSANPTFVSFFLCLAGNSTAMTSAGRATVWHHHRARGYPRNHNADVCGRDFAGVLCARSL